MSKETVQLICFVVVCITALFFAATIMNQDTKINSLEATLKVLEVAFKASETLNEGLTVTNKFLQVKYDNLVGKKEGYNYFGYWIEMPEEQDVHVLINYPEDYPLNEFRRMLLREHHRYGLKEIKAKDWNEEQNNE